MINALAYVVVGVAVIGVGWGVLTTVRGQAVGWAQLGWAALVELIILAQSIIAGTAMIGGFRPVEYATTIGYLIGIAVLLPLAAVWVFSDRSRFSGAVLAVAQAGALAMTLRLLALWTSGG